MRALASPAKASLSQRDRYLDIATRIRREWSPVIRIGAAVERKSEQMPTMGPANLDLYVCPKAHENWKPVPGVNPPRPNCSQCGRQYLSQCAECGKTYSGIDLEAKFHACGAKIPWARDWEKVQRKAGRITWDELEHGKSPASAPGPWWKRGLFGIGRFWTAVAIAVIAAVIVIFVRSWLITEKLISP
jgi:hypothetical protein